jgi:hypothetical protein
MFHGMKLYTVHTKSGSDITLDKPIFLREGFNWLAFLFTFIWALYQRLWVFAIVIVAANILVMTALKYGYISPFPAALVQFAMQFVVGFHANDFLRQRMQKQGYIFQDITSGDSLLRAEQRYFDRLVSA